MSFRYASKKLFLTYARPTTDHTQFTLDALHEFLLSFAPEYVVTCTEKHTDGTDHFHAVLTWSTRKNFKDPRKFDFMEWHPKWEKPRNLEASITYVKKDGSWLEEGSKPSNDDYAKIAEDYESKSEWMSWCVRQKIGQGYAEFFWKQAHPPADSTIWTTPTEGRLNNALSTFTFTEWSTHACILVGPTGCGKTVWAKRHAPKPALMVSHIDQLRDFKPEVHNSIIFDDMVFKHFPVQSQIHLVDQYEDRAIHCRYNTALIPKKTPKIFTCNERPVDTHPAINRRVRVFNISEDRWGQENEPRLIQ